MSLGVSQSGSGCRDCILAGVCFGWGARMPEARSVPQGGALGLRVPRGPPPKPGPAVPRLPLALSHPLTKIPLAGGLQPVQRGRETALSAAGGGDFADPRARGLAEGGRRRRPAERRVPGDPGLRARRPERPPPAFPPRGAHPSPGGPLPTLTQHAIACTPARPPGSCAPWSPPLRAPAAPQRAQRVPGRRPHPRGAWPGAPAKAAQVRRPWRGSRTLGPGDPTPRALQVRAPRGPRRGLLPLFPGRPGGARAPSPRLPPGRPPSAREG